MLVHIIWETFFTSNVTTNFECVVLSRPTGGSLTLNYLG